MLNYQLHRDSLTKKIECIGKRSITFAIFFNLAYCNLLFQIIIDLSFNNRYIIENNQQMIFHKNQIILATLNYKTKNKKTKKIFMKENFKIQSKICMHY